MRRVHAAVRILRAGASTSGAQPFPSRESPGTLSPGLPHTHLDTAEQASCQTSCGHECAYTLGKSQREAELQKKEMFLKWHCVSAEASREGWGTCFQHSGQLLGQPVGPSGLLLLPAPANPFSLSLPPSGEKKPNNKNSYQALPREYGLQKQTDEGINFLDAVTVHM